jgi:di/tricarboxylate transporter
MSVDAWITVGVVIALLVGLVRNLAPPDLLFVGGTAFLSVMGIITPEQAFAGFANPGMLTVAFLFVVVAALRETGVLDYVGHHVLGKAQTERAALVRLSFFIVPMSAMLNNTPIVAMFIPIVLDWCRRWRISPAKLLIPLSFLTILGGTCTLIGTSTTLVINGLMVDNGIAGMGLFEIGKVGLPYAIVGSLFLLVFGRRLLPERKELMEQLQESRRDYMVEMRIQTGCRLSGKSVEGAGLRQLPGLYLIEIEREGQIIAPVRPDDVLQALDRLVFTGIVSSILELERIPGLVAIDDSDAELSSKGSHDRRLVEAVVSQSSSLNGKRIRDADFRAVYGAAVVAVHRFGERVKQKIGDIELRTGDTLLLQTPPHFLRAHRHDPNFYLVSQVDQWRPIRRNRGWLAVGLFVLLMGLMTSGAVPIVIAAAATATLMIALGCLSANDARQSIEWQVLITIAASFGVGTALQNSGAATYLAQAVVGSTAAWGPIAGLIIIYIFGSIITELVTNNAAAVLMFPICVETAKLYSADSRPFIIALALAASASFMTPIGYQTNMMVYGPGGYRFMDFFRIGAPLNIILGIIAIILIPIFWPF